MIKLVGFSLLGLLAIMLMPASLTDTATNPYFGGIATIVLVDADGNEKLAQQVHNRIVNTGEDFLIDVLFADGTGDVADALAVGKVCVFQHSIGFGTITDGNDTAAFDSTNQNDAVNPCVSDLLIGTAGGIAIIDGSGSGVSFTESANIDASEIVRGIGICTIGTTDTTSCAGNGSILFALATTGSVTPGTGDSILITYTFDISDDTQ